MTRTKALIFERWWICFSSNSQSMFMKMLSSAWVIIFYVLCIHTLYDDDDKATLMKRMCTLLLAFPKPNRIAATYLRMKLVYSENERCRCYIIRRRTFSSLQKRRDSNRRAPLRNHSETAQLFIQKPIATHSFLIKISLHSSASVVFPWKIWRVLKSWDWSLSLLLSISCTLVIIIPA